MAPFPFDACALLKFGPWMKFQAFCKSRSCIRSVTAFDVSCSLFDELYVICHNVAKTCSLFRGGLGLTFLGLRRGRPVM